MPKIMKIGWQLTKLLQKLSGLLFWPTLYVKMVYNYVQRVVRLMLCLTVLLWLMMSIGMQPKNMS